MTFSRNDKPSPPDLSLQRQLSAESLTLPEQTQEKLQAPGLAERKMSMLQAYTIDRESGPAVKVTVTGKTNAVGFHPQKENIDNKEVEVGSLFNGKELKTSFDKDSKIEIDPTHAIVSRRGPHQESMGWHKKDFNSDPEYTWYPIHSTDSRKYKEEGWPYIRANTLAEHETLAASAESLRKRAAPTHEYQKIADITVEKFIENQKDYQAKLLGSCTKEQILTSHRSVGFEYEFIGHSSEKLPSHVKLAKSEPYSKLFEMSFELESDSGDVVEIVMPPFIVPNLPDGSPNNEEIYAVYKKMEQAVEELRDGVLADGDSGVGLSKFAERLTEKGLGKGWEVSKENEKNIEGMKVQKSDAEKFKGGRIYSQMNISLDGDESARLINIIQKKYRPGTAETSIIGKAYEEIQKKVPEGVDGGHYVHLSKTMASALAIPSILLQRERVELSRDDDLSSTVKELLGTWVKDTMPNILKTTSASDADLRMLKDFAVKDAKPIIMDSFSDLKESLGYYRPRLNEREDWDKFKKAYENGTVFSDGIPKRINRGGYETIGEDKDFKEIVEMVEWMENSVSGDDFAINGVAISDAHQEYKEIESKYKDYSKNLNPKIRNKIDELSEDEIFKTIWETFDEEIENIIEKINTPDIVRVERNDFGAEKFRNGEVGVRKDTYIIPDPNSIISVVELRSDEAIKIFKDANLKA